MDGGAFALHIMIYYIIFDTVSFLQLLYELVVVNS